MKKESDEDLLEFSLPAGCELLNENDLVKKTLMMSTSSSSSSEIGNKLTKHIMI